MTAWPPWPTLVSMGVLLMGEVRYAVRVRGHRGDAVQVALREGLEVATDPVRTVLRGRVPARAARLGIRATAGRLGLARLADRRLPHGGSR